MNTAKRITRLAAGIAVLATVVIPLYPTMPFVETAVAQPPLATGHLVWDDYDQVWHCVGSPLNCG